MFRKYQKKTLFIVTNKAPEVCEVIKNVTNHGATVLEGEGSYEHCERNVVYSVVSAVEYKKLIIEIRKVDDKSFINTVRTDYVAGRFYHRSAD